MKIIFKSGLASLPMLPNNLFDSVFHYTSERLTSPVGKVSDVLMSPIVVENQPFKQWRKNGKRSMAKERDKVIGSLLGEVQQQLCECTTVYGLQKLGFIRILRIGRS